MMQATLPFLRQRRTGHILNISSMGGLMAFPGISAYHGSKFALEGISESLAKEVKHLGIKVTIVEPGGFRTDWAGRSMRHVERTIEDYEPSAGASRNGSRDAQRTPARRSAQSGGSDAACYECQSRRCIFCWDRRRCNWSAKSSARCKPRS